MKRFILGLVLLIAVFSFFTQKNYADEVPLSVTATIHPQPSDMSIAITATEPEGTYLFRDQEVTFTASYDAVPVSGFPLTLIASWEEGLIVGSTANYVEAYDYVLGSATNADDGTVPVIDLLNRTITWSIPSVGASGSPHEVSFTLKVKSTFLTTDFIQVYTNLDATYQTAVIPQETYLLYIDPLTAAATPTPGATSTPTQTPTAGPTATVTLGPSATPTPAIIPSFQQFIFKDVEIQSVTDTTALVTSTTSLDSTLRVLYGECSNATFTDVFSLSQSNPYHEIQFENLTPDTSYCFRIDATNTLIGKTIQSDVFTFKTAREGDAYVINSSRTLWNSLQLNSSFSRNLLVPEGLSAVLSLEISHPELISQLDGEFVNRSVLGASSLGRQNTQQVRFIEVGSGIFSAEIQTPKITGNYYFTLRIKDTNGRYSKILFPYSYTTSPFLHVIDQDENPVENAYVSIERFEESRGQYAPFNAAFTLNQAQKSFFLPYATDARGQLRIALPIGKYRFTTRAIGYGDTTTEFIIQENTSSYPEITLVGSFSISSYIQYIQMTVQTAYDRFQYDADQYFSTRIILTLSMIFQGIMLGGIGIFLLGKVGIIDRLHSKLAMFLRDFEEELFELFMGGWAIVNMIFTVLFIIFQGFLSSLPMILITIILIILNILIFLFKEKTLHPNIPRKSS